MTWIKDQMKDHIIDQIIKMIMTKSETDENKHYFYNQKFTLNPKDYRKYVSPSGYIETGDDPDVDKSIIYQEDYQKSSESIDGFIDNICSCYETGTINEYGDKLHNEPTGDWVDDQDWTFNLNGFATDPCDDSTMTCVDELGNEIAGYPSSGAGGNTAFISAVHSGCPDGTGGTMTNTFILDIFTPAVTACSGAECDYSVLGYLSQIISLDPDITKIDSSKAGEVLDTTIYELLPGIQTRQERVNKVFTELSGLLFEMNPPTFDLDGDGNVDASWDIGDNLGPSSEDWSNQYDIEKLGPNAGYITRLIRHEGDSNVNQSIEWLRNSLNPYLVDRDTIIDPDEDDQRIDYADVSEGYLKFRGLNQSIIVRSETNDTIGLEDYQTDGFTIAMWVRFIDKKSNGTLFNYGAPMSEGSTFGFMLETFAVGEDDCIDSACSNTFGAYRPDLFTDTSHARFVRLVVRDQSGNLKNSHVGSTDTDRKNTTPHIFDQMIPLTDESVDPAQALTYTRVPTDRNEWYFIVANFNPAIDEQNKTYNGCTGDATGCTGSTGECDPNCVDLKNSPDYWRWNVSPNLTASEPGSYTNNSTEGAQCKVEIISKSDLLLARGYKP